MDEITKFRLCLGRFATGVTVVSCRDEDGAPCGITANSFSSVSLDPPLVAWNIAKVSRSLQAFLKAENFAINILRSDQQDISSRFAKSETNLFAGIEYTDAQDKVPLIDSTLAHLLCRTFAIHDCGDHFIIVGQVSSFVAEEGEPLLFYNGRYAELQR